METNMTRRSGPEKPKRRYRMSLVGASLLIATVALPLGISAFGASSAQSIMVDRAGARFMSYQHLIEDPGKFDRKAVWISGALTMKAQVAYFGELDEKSVSQNVCVEPTRSFFDPGGSMEREVLRRFDGLEPISLHGRYERVATPQCPNGTVFVALVEVSLE